MEVIKIKPEEVLPVKSPRAAAGQLIGELLKKRGVVTPIRAQEEIGKIVREMIEEHIKTQTAMARELAKGVREATEKAKKRDIPQQAVGEMQQSYQMVREKALPVVTPSEVPKMIEVMPRAIREEINRLYKKMEQYRRPILLQEIRAQIRAYRRMADDLRESIGKIKTLCHQLGIDPSLPEIAGVLQAAEIMAASFEEQARARERYLEEKGKIREIL